MSEDRLVKTPQPGEWWFGRYGNRVFIHGYNRKKELMYEYGDGSVAVGGSWKDWHHEPACTGWDWQPSVTMTPREAMILRATNDWFTSTFGCVELEMIAQVVLSQLCWSNNWAAWLSYDNFGGDERFGPPWKWSHGHGFVGVQWQGCTFDEYVTCHQSDKNRFQVNEKFIRVVCQKGTHAGTDK